jgi:hypothetical protein
MLRIHDAKEITMAHVTLSSVPREFEVTRQFEAQQADEAELKSLHDKLFSADMDADVRMTLGRTMEQLRITFLRVLWGRFGQFVQRIVVFAQQPGAGLGPSPPAGAITKSEVTKRYATSTDDGG